VPEGDTLFRVAARLRPALVGVDLRGFRAPRLTGPRPVPGHPILGVDAMGKHLLVRFGQPAGTLVLRTHLRMTGSWHLYRTGDRWQRPARQAVVVIDVDGWTAVCSNAPVVETTWEGRPAPALAVLGPDLCRPDADLDEVLRRLDERSVPADEIAPLLLDQRVAAGIGNVYKSEALFACGVDPWTPVGALDAGARRRLWSTAAVLLRANLGTVGPRRTVPGGLAVYGRARRPCRTCGTTVARAEQAGRSTYWCPSCQRPFGADGR
jgi:endonuclease VIII